jgi:hypothetical protein
MRREPWPLRRRLREYAEYVQRLFSGPRTAGNPPAPPAGDSKASIVEDISPTADAKAKGDDKAAGKKSREDELRDQIMRKYTTGLR